MRYYTHAAFGLFLALLLTISFPIENKLLFIFIVILFSLLPDIDEPKSYAGSKVKLISYPLNFIFGHRNIFHSIFIPLILFLLLFNFNIEVAIAVFIGYCSHLLMDGTTPQGIKPFYPFKFRLRGPIQTNSLTERIIFFLLITPIIVIVLLYVF